MKLKCIGGRCDGQIGHTHDDNPITGEAVKVPIYLKEVDYMLPPVSEDIGMFFAIYIVDELRYAHSS